MSKGPENTFIGSVHRHLPAELYRMKNHNEYNGGIADCWYSGQQCDLWVEYKFLEVPKRPFTEIHLCDPKKPYGLSTLQQEWLTGRFEEGRNVAVIVGCKDGGVIYPRLEWGGFNNAQTFQRNLVTRKEIAEWITRYVNG